MSLENGFFRTLAINFIHNFIASAVAVLLPLYLLEKNVSIESIGLIFSVLSIIMLIFRFIFAVIADYLGTRLIFVGNAIAHVLTLVVYTLSSTPLHFAFGKVVEGFRAAAFWSVNRTEIYHIEEKQAAKNASIMGAARAFSTVFGRVAIAIALIFISIQSSFLLLVLVSSLLFYFSLSVRNGKEKRRLKLSAFMIELKKKHSKEFWAAALVLSIAAIYEAPLLAIVIPLYMAEVLKSSPAIIGFGLALYSLSFSLSSYIAAKHSMHIKNIVLGAIFFGVLPILFIQNVEHVFLLFLFLSGIGGGLGLVNIMETIMARIVKSSVTPSIDISILIIPYRLVEFATLAAVGFAITSFGFHSVFLALVASFAVYALLAWSILNKGLE